MGRLPVLADFPKDVRLAIVKPPGKDPPTNVLILLHGLGDRHESFARLAEQMSLPETVCLAIQGPKALLDLDGSHWGDDIIFDSSNGGLDSDAGFSDSSKHLKDLLNDVLIGKCGYTPRDILFFGFGQGGMAALSIVVAHHEAGLNELGGVISIGAGLSNEITVASKPKSKTPALVCAGSTNSAVTSTTEDKLKRVFDAVEIVKYRRGGDRMPSNRDEMMPIMQFFGRRLRSMKGIPEGSIEVPVTAN